MNKSGVSSKKAKSKEYDHFVKVVLVGKAAVGKSSIMLRYSDNTFNEFYVNTIGVDFRFKTMEVKGRKVKVQVWDTAGQEKFRTISSTYYRGADAILFVYDITDASSFSDLFQYWFPEVQDHAPEVPMLILVGNKIDREEDRKVAKNDKHYIVNMGGKERKALHYEVSAKNNVGVNEIFEDIAIRYILAREAKKASKSILQLVKEKPLTKIEELEEEEGSGSKSMEREKGGAKAASDGNEKPRYIETDMLGTGVVGKASPERITTTSLKGPKPGQGEEAAQSNTCMQCS